MFDIEYKILYYKLAIKKYTYAIVIKQKYIFSKIIKNTKDKMFIRDEENEWE